MDKKKRARLEAAGWRFSTVKDFLNLTDEEMEYIELKVKLAKLLQERRRKRNLGQVELAKLVQSSQSRVAKMEAADESVSLDLIIRSLLALGISRPELGRLIALP